jgi:hypothetical protein
MLHDEHGAGRVAHDILRDASGEQVPDEPLPVLAHDDQLDIELARAGDDCVADARVSRGFEQILRVRVLLVAWAQ